MLTLRIMEVPTAMGLLPRSEQRMVVRAVMQHSDRLRK